MIALVTGGGNPRGIGAACVRALADRGATVAYTVMRGEQPPADVPGTPFTTDLSEPDAPEHLLDAILEGYVERDLGREQLIARGLPADDVDRVIRMVDLAEYKRRQQPPGVKITTKAFGRDRRMPITNAYRPEQWALTAEDRDREATRGAV